MVDSYSPVKGKCTWWREFARDEDLHDVTVAADDRRVTCSCFVEGQFWEHRAAEVPSDCPFAKQCRYYIRHS